MEEAANSKQALFAHRAGALAAGLKTPAAPWIARLSKL